MGKKANKKPRPAQNMSSDYSIDSKSTLGMHSSAWSTVRRRKREQKKITNMSTFIRESFNNLFDLVGDWVYFYAIYNRLYIEGDVDAEEFDKILLVLIFFCVLSTVLSLWTMQTAILTLCGRKSMCCNCTVPRLSLLGVVLEDFPQFVLTFYIDSKLVGSVTPVAVLNICTSLSSLVSRLTSRYEEVRDEPVKKVKPIGGLVEV